MFVFKKLGGLYLLLLLFWITSCSNQAEKNEDTNSLDSTNTDSTSVVSLSTYYQIPSPSNLFNYLKNNGVKVSNVNNLNLVTNIKKLQYISRKSRQFWGLFYRFVFL